MKKALRGTNHVKNIPTRWFTHNRFGRACFVLLHALLSSPSILHPSDSALHLPSPSKNYKLCSAKNNSTPFLPNSYSHVFPQKRAPTSLPVKRFLQSSGQNFLYFINLNMSSILKPIPKKKTLTTKFQEGKSLLFWAIYDKSLTWMFRSFLGIFGGTLQTSLNFSPPIWGDQPSRRVPSSYPRLD